VGTLVECCAKALADGREPSGMASVLLDEEWQLVALINFRGDDIEAVTDHKAATYVVLGGALAGADAVVTVFPAWLKSVPRDQPMGLAPSEDPASGSVLMVLALMVMDLTEDTGAIVSAGFVYPYGLRDDGTYWLGEAETFPTQDGEMLSAVAHGAEKGPLVPEEAAKLLALLEHDVVLAADGLPRFN
jgi:hypothetical protein